MIDVCLLSRGSWFTQQLCLQAIPKTNCQRSRRIESVVVFVSRRLNGLCISRVFAEVPKMSDQELNWSVLPAPVEALVNSPLRTLVNSSPLFTPLFSVR